MKRKTAPRKKSRNMPVVMDNNLKQKNIAVAVMVLVLVGLFFFITYIRLKTGANLLNQ